MNRFSRKNCKGFTVSELIVAGTVLALAMAFTVQVIAAVAITIRDIDRQSFARDHANNFMEQATTLPWEMITPESLNGRLKLDPSIDDVLPGADLDFTVTPDSDDSKRITVKISWEDSTGQRVHGTRFVCWVYEPGDSP